MVIPAAAGSVERGSYNGVELCGLHEDKRDVGRRIFRSLRRPFLVVLRYETVWAMCWRFDFKWLRGRVRGQLEGDGGEDGVGRYRHLKGAFSGGEIRR